MSSKKWLWKEAAEVIGVLGVIASLIVVAFEIRANTNATLSTAIQGIAEQSIDLNTLFVENADLRAAFAVSNSEEGSAGLSEDQRMQLVFLNGSTMRLQTHRFQLIQLGILNDEDVYATSFGLAYCTVFFAEFWQRARSSYSDEFIDWFDANAFRDCDR